MENFKSIRDSLEESLKAANRTTFLYRVIYIGQHDFESTADLKEYFQRNIDHCNKGYCYEKLTGFLLCYPNLLIHLIEGSEDVIHSHFELLCTKQKIDELHDLRIVIIWPHLIARATNNWFAKSGQPKKSDIEVYSTCQASPFVRLCINSMCILAETLSGEQTSKTLFQEGCDIGSKSIDPIPVELIPKLPVSDQIEFLTKCTVLVSLQEAYEYMYRISKSPYEVLRLGRFLDTLYGALSTIHHSDIIVRITVTLSRISSALSLLADHILWVGRTGFMTVDNNRWNTVSSKYWLYSVVMSLIRDVYEIWRVFSTGENRSRLPTSSKSSQDGVNSIHSLFPLNTIKTVRMFCAEHQNVALDTFKNACDIFIPLAALDYVRISPGAIGLLGVASTFAAILQLLDPMKRLTPS